MFLLFDFQEAEKFKAMVDSLQKVLLQRCDKEGKTVQTFKFHLHFKIAHLYGTDIVHMAQRKSWTALSLRTYFWLERTEDDFPISVFALNV